MSKKQHVAALSHQLSVVMQKLFCLCLFCVKTVSCKVLITVLLIHFVIMDQTADFYSRPSHEFRGGAFNVFAGSRRQRGGGIFGTLKNFFLPVARKLGKSLLSQGVGLANDIARDAMEGKSIKQSLMNRGKSRALDFGKTAAKEGVGALTDMIGKGSRRAPRRRKRLQKTRRRKSKVTRRRQRKTSRKTASRKRRSRSTHRPKAKRRRVNF